MRQRNALLRAAMDRQPGDIGALEQDAAAGRPQHADQHAQERRLAGAVGADQAEQLAFGDGQIDAGERVHAAEIHRYIVDVEQAHRRAPAMSWLTMAARPPG